MAVVIRRPGGYVQSAVRSFTVFHGHIQPLTASSRWGGEGSQPSSACGRSFHQALCHKLESSCGSVVIRTILTTEEGVAGGRKAGTVGCRWRDDRPGVNRSFSATAEREKLGKVGMEVFFLVHSSYTYIYFQPDGCRLAISPHARICFLRQGRAQARKETVFHDDVGERLYGGETR